MSKKKRKAFDPMTLETDEEYVRCIDRQLVHSALGYPRACPNRRCRRHRKCVGDPDYCHAIFWPVVPEEAKVWLRSLDRSGEANHTVKKAERIAEAALRDHQRRARAFKRLEESGHCASHK